MHRFALVALLFASCASIDRYEVASTPANAGIDAPPIEYESVQKPISRLIAEQPTSVYTPIEGEETETELDFLDESCPPHIDLPNYANDYAYDNNEDYGDSLSSDYTSSSLYNDDAGSDDEGNSKISRPSGIPSRSADPSPIGSGSRTRFR